jgi:membrane protein implicated in regulation of membrane protease activity
MDLIVYAICFGVGLLFVALNGLFGHIFGGGHDVHTDVGAGGHAEAGFDDSGMPGLSPFSPTSIAAFITSFGALGLILSRLETTRSPWISAPLAIIGGLAIAAVIVVFFSMVFQKTQSSSESRVGLLIGSTGTIITPVPSNGVGEIAYVHRGTRYTAPARNEFGEQIAVGRSVAIVRIVGNQFYVTPV